MMAQLIKLYFKGKANISDVAVKRAYASLSSVAGIILNLLLCTAKIVTGLFSRSVAISADGFNNLSDAGISLMTLLGFQIARYGRGSTHPFGHGRFEWIMGIFASLAVVLMGGQLIHTAVQSIVNPQKPLFSVATVIVLVLSILVKAYMYFYNRQFAKVTNSETLKATAADCISDAAATGAVLLSTVIGHITGWQIDGYCGAVVSGFIVIAGIKSLWEVLGRVMGQATDQSMIDDVLRTVEAYPEIAAVQNLMVHDYGFGYFVISLRVEGYRKDSEQLYNAIHEISCTLYKQFHCDCFIQADYLIDDDVLTAHLQDKAEIVLQRYGGKVSIDHFRLLESGRYTTIAFDLLYPAELQKSEEVICQEIEKELKTDNLQYRTIIKSILRRERYGSHRRNKFKNQEDNQ
ncbi:cation diffusion facilitator family transporter [uncultured Dysosmobacter sp.]|uniref:cation diffusion facilitator family transporter n=1 Tax=uncultured Dysosmobacter sp. TaxID=2591384 RepID=UPI00261D841E|nr:cation diffusion facilitator family transporter [uncultured Dysosmobacter sp.]